MSEHHHGADQALGERLMQLARTLSAPGSQMPGELVGLLPVRLDRTERAVACWSSSDETGAEARTYRLVSLDGTVIDDPAALVEALQLIAALEALEELADGETLRELQDLLVGWQEQATRVAAALPTEARSAHEDLVMQLWKSVEALQHLEHDLSPAPDAGPRCASIRALDAACQLLESLSVQWNELEARSSEWNATVAPHAEDLAGPLQLVLAAGRSGPLRIDPRTVIEHGQAVGSELAPRRGTAG